MKFACLLLTLSLMTFGCIPGKPPVQTVQTHYDASVAALNAYCDIAMREKDVDISTICATVLGTMNATQGAVDQALAFITSLLAKRAQEAKAECHQ